MTSDISRWRRWRYQFQTMVRYRLLMLASAPILFTLVALMGISLYWTLHYTWQSALGDVSGRLAMADNSMRMLESRQLERLTAFSHSYGFVRRMNGENGATLNDTNASHWNASHWLNQQRDLLGLDYLTLTFNRAGAAPGTRGEVFFDRLTAQAMAQKSETLVSRALTPVVAENRDETSGLFIRALVPVKNAQGQVIGQLDGGRLLNNRSELVDEVRRIIYPTGEDRLRPLGTVTLFLGDIRISTNVPLDSHSLAGRATGTRVSQEVKQQVLIGGQRWVNLAYVQDAWYISAYQPLSDRQGQVIGMLYTGYRLWPFVEAYLFNILEIGMITVSLLLVTGIVVYRGSRDLFRPIEKIHRVVKMVQMGKEQRIGPLGLNDNHELSQLARQFDNMLDLLQRQNQKMSASAKVLEEEVERRTARLRDKTAQLEHHIQLLNQTRDKLIVHEKLASLGELTAGIAHEINNPAAVILGNAELIRFELGEHADTVKDELDSIMQQIDRIRNITRSLLQYSRQGGVQDEITWHHVNPIVEESITLVKTGTKKRDIEFVTILHARTRVEVNRHQLLQILVNLQMNGIHAMDGHGRLTITTDDWLEHGTAIGAVIHVTDEGCGIRSEMLKRIFDPFYTTKRDGTGLGLSVSQSMLSRIGGDITVRSEIGKGSTFTVYLPHKAESELLLTQAV